MRLIHRCAVVKNPSKRRLLYDSSSVVVVCVAGVVSLTRSDSDQSVSATLSYLSYLSTQTPPAADCSVCVSPFARTRPITRPETLPECRRSQTPATATLSTYRRLELRKIKLKNIYNNITINQIRIYYLYSTQPTESSQKACYANERPTQNPSHYIFLNPFYILFF